MSTVTCAFCGSNYPLPNDICPSCGMAPAFPTRALPPGTTLQGGRFTVGRVLGEGGFGITYKGAHKPLQRVVAIKELFPADAQRQGRNVLVSPQRQGEYQKARADALQEARHIAQLHSPGIVEVYDTFQENDTIYMVMEYLEGQTLQDQIQDQGSLPAAAVHRLALAVCEALQVMHDQQLLHRDLKPDNLMLTRDGRTVLIDFGSVRQYRAGRTVRHTRILTADYAAPEQYSQSARFGPYTDIFALGATLYHALTGSLPRRAIERLQDPDLDLTLPAGVSPALAQAIDQALRLPVPERPPTVQALRQLLDAGTAGGVVTPASTPFSLGGSPQNYTLASGSNDGTVRLWNIATGQRRHVLRGHRIGVNTWVHTVAFSPDGRTLASGGLDKTVRLWDVATGQARHSLQGHGPGVHTVAFSPDGHTLASGGLDKTVRLWDAASGQCRHVLQGHAESVNTVAFSPDGRTLASGDDDGAVRLWDAASGQCRHILKGHTESVNTVVFSPDSRTLASEGVDRTMRLWDVASGQCRHILQGRHKRVYAVAFSPDGHTLASGSTDGAVRLWDVASGQCRHVLQGHRKRVYTVAFSSDDHTLASGSTDKTVRLWDVASGQCRHILQGHDESVNTVAFSPDGHTLASGSRDKLVRLWDVVSGQQRHVLQGHTKGINIVVFSPH